MNKEQIRHGENHFIRVDKLPKGAKLVKQGNSLIVAHSETGHHHLLTVPKEAQIKIFELDGVTYLDIPLEAKLSHQKTVEAHPDLKVQPGIYKKIVQSEYDYSAKLSKRVID